MNRKGVDAIVATVLIILITIAAVAIIWAFVIPMVKDSIKDSSSSKAELVIDSSGKYTTWDATNNISRIQISRGNDNLSLTGVEFIFTTNGISTKIISDKIVQPNGQMVYSFPLGAKPDSISIAPITSSGVGAIVSTTSIMSNYVGSDVVLPAAESIPQIITVSGATDNLVQDIEHSSVTINSNVLDYIMILDGRPRYADKLTSTSSFYVLSFNGSNWVAAYEKDEPSLSKKWVSSQGSESYLPPTGGWSQLSGPSSSFLLLIKKSPNALLTSSFNGEYTYNASQSKWLKGTSHKIYKEGTTWKMTDGNINYTAPDNGLTTPPTSFNYSINGAFVSTATVTISLPVDGFCGFSVNNCSSGNFSDVADNPNYYLWDCNGLNGGTNDNCQFAKLLPVNGTCNTTLNTCLNNTTLLDLVDNSTHYLWNCNGLYGGLNASCNKIISYCVAKDGTGTYKNITSAVANLASGSTCLVKAGNYSSEGRITISRSGNSGSLLTFEGVPNSTTNVTTKGFTINGNYIKIKGFYVTDTDNSWTDGYGIFVAGDEVLIENNYVYYATRGGIYVTTSSDKSIVRNNKLQRNGMAGISIRGTNHLVENNEIWASIQRHPKLGPSYPDWLDADGMRLFGSGHTIRGNYIHNISHADPENVRNGTYPVPHIDCFQTWDEGEPFTDSVLENNICDNAEKLDASDNMGTHGFMLHSARNITFRNNIFKAYTGINTDNVIPCSNLYFYNNVFAGNINIKYSDANLSWPSGIGLDNVSNAIVKNNIFFDNDYSPFGMSGSNLSCSNNIIYKSDGSTLRPNGCSGGYTATNPKFVNPSLGNYSLQSTSPAINAGAIVPVATDIRGVYRPINSKWDIGAFEVG